MNRLSQEQLAQLQERLSYLHPERRDQGQSLAVLGGFQTNLAALNLTYQYALDFGIGSCTFCVPKTIQTVFKDLLPSLQGLSLDRYQSITNSGKTELLNAFFDSASGFIQDLPKNSTTDLFVARLVSDSAKPIVLSSTALNILLSNFWEFLDNPNVLLFLDFKALQSLSTKLKLGFTVKSHSPIQQKIAFLKEISSRVRAKLILSLADHTNSGQNIFIATDGKTYLLAESNLNELQIATHAACLSAWDPKLNALELLAGAV